VFSFEYEPLVSFHKFETQPGFGIELEVRAFVCISTKAVSIAC